MTHNVPIILLYFLSVNREKIDVIIIVIHHSRLESLVIICICTSSDDAMLLHDSPFFYGLMRC